MRVLVQRVTSSSVEVEGKIVGKIDNGMVILVGFTRTDNSTNIDYMVEKVLNLRIYDDDNGIMNKSILDAGGSILSISQFTLYGDCRKGRRPNFMAALGGSEAEVLYNKFLEEIKKEGIKVETGIFGADMKVSIENDGPVTLILESKKDF